MKPTASAEPEPRVPQAGGTPPGAAPAADPSQPAVPSAAAGTSEHDPEAKALLRRYLAEVHGFREIGNQALRSLEARLATLPQIAENAIAEPQAAPAAAFPNRTPAASPLTKPSLPSTQPAGRGSDPNLKLRLNELSSYLHADLLREGTEAARTPGAARQPRREARQHPAEIARSRLQGRDAPQQQSAEPAPGRAPQAPHKAPTLPVLDRAWFEERFAVLRASVDRLTEEVPLKRLEALERQFHQLMERLAARETARDPRPLEDSLKALADYLADGRDWQAASEKRIHGVEDRLDRLSNLVARSHAAISATAQGLEIIAKGTGENLARATAGIVVARLGEKLDRANPAERLNQLGKDVSELARNNPAPRLEELGRDVAELARKNPGERIDQLGREVAHLTAQSRMLTRSTEDRLTQIEVVLKESARPAPRITTPVQMAQGRPSPEKPGLAEYSSREELEKYLNRHPPDSDDDYDSEMIAAAQRAARLADGQAQNAPVRPGPVRYQIPYGEFLPDEDGNTSRAGLIIAVVILLLAGAIMLFLKAKEWTLIEPRPAATLEDRSRVKISAAPHASQPAAPVAGVESASIAAPAPALVRDITSQPVVTGSTPAAPPLTVKPLQLWVASKAPDRADPRAKPAAPAKPADTDESFREAAVKGDMNAQFSVGQSYLAGADGETDLSGGDRVSKAARWFRRAAENGHAPSQYRLATLYELGQGVPRDLAEAERWYERAASQGHVKAMHNLAVLAVSKKRHSVNYVTAFKWFREAAAYGLVDSQFNLGILYENGLGAAKSAVDAYVWFALAARQHDQKAVQKRDDVALTLTAADRQRADRIVNGWTAKPRSEAVNRIAPEPPTAAEDHQTSVTPPPPQPANTAVMSAASWSAGVAALPRGSGMTALVGEAQRLLKQMGYYQGALDGVAGPRTLAAIRSFQRRAGLKPTGEVSEELIVKMAFLPL